MKKIINFLCSFILISFFIVPLIVSAQESNTIENNSNSMLGRLETVGAGGGYVIDETASISTVVGSVINVALSFLGIIFIILIIYSGYTWMTASGNEEQVKKSTKIITRAIIGLIITLSSWAIWFFVFQNLINIE